ncbi:DUF6192 family protein [Streptomyces sp. NPDC001828]|uniref:DUF6192 family protein n=1 Tax=Streptomyces sp. NPDC001828 TaxID=3364615 RepID=UPI0036987F54
MSFTVHNILAAIADDEERFTTILNPSEGKPRWTPDEANRRIGRQVVEPVTPQEKVSAIHSLAKDDEVAGRVTGDLLRRPEVVAQVRDEDKVRVVEELTRDEHVAFKAMSDDTARHQVNRAQNPTTRAPQARNQAPSYWRDDPFRRLILGAKPSPDLACWPREQQAQKGRCRVIGRPKSAPPDVTRGGRRMKHQRLGCPVAPASLPERSPASNTTGSGLGR